MALDYAAFRRAVVSVFPDCLHDHVRRQINSMKVLFESDNAYGLNGVSLPDAYGRKCPSARMNFAWWYLFTADEYSKCPHTGVLYRHHRDMDNVARRIREGCQRVDVRIPTETQADMLLKKHVKPTVFFWPHDSNSNVWTTNEVLVRSRE